MLAAKGVIVGSGDEMRSIATGRRWCYRQREKEREKRERERDREGEHHKKRYQNQKTRDVNVPPQVDGHFRQFRHHLDNKNPISSAINTRRKKQTNKQTAERMH